MVGYSKVLKWFKNIFKKHNGGKKDMTMEDMTTTVTTTVSDVPVVEVVSTPAPPVEPPVALAPEPELEPEPVVPPEPEPTFREKVADMVMSLVDALESDSAADTDIDVKEKAVSRAKVQLSDAESGQKAAVSAREGTRESVSVTIDTLVSLLRSWQVSN